MAGKHKGKLQKNVKHDFVQLAGGVERLLALQSWDEVDVLADKFKLIDPDSIRPTPQQDNQETVETAEILNLREQQDFLKQMAPYLKKAGYTEISQSDIKFLLSSFHTEEEIELKLNLEDFEFIRIWVFGKHGSPQKKTDSLKTMTEKQWKKLSAQYEYQPGTSLCHRRVVVAARSKKRDNMIFKCFKDVPVGHFEALIPQAKIHIPWRQKWFWNTILLASGFTFFINFGLWLQSDLKFGYLVVMVSVMSFIVYRTRIVYRNIRNRYAIMWKQMLYYKSTSNNSALAMELFHRARGQSFKKTMLAYVAALQVASRNKGAGMQSQQIEDQCFAWFEKIGKDFPDRQVGAIDLKVGISNLLGMGLLSHNENKTYEILDVASALKKVEQELVSLCHEVCDSS